MRVKDPQVDKIMSSPAGSKSGASVSHDPSPPQMAVVRRKAPCTASRCQRSRRRMRAQAPSRTNLELKMADGRATLVPYGSYTGTLVKIRPYPPTTAGIIA